MNTLLQYSKLTDVNLGEVLKDEIAKGNPDVLGIASAFVSVDGMQHVLSVAKSAKIKRGLLVAGISHCITHPEALHLALDAGWNVKISDCKGRWIFHPKLIISGKKLNAGGLISSTLFSYVGSSNLTYAGLFRNVECGIVGNGNTSIGLEKSFSDIWKAGQRLTKGRIDKYADHFSKKNKRRSLQDLEALGVTDSTEPKRSYSDVLRGGAQAPPPSVSYKGATAAWAGLESFTGEYRFQVEFPKAAGRVLQRLINPNATGEIDVFCSEDNRNRSMSYKFYDDNGMFRINIPNDVPGVGLARSQKSGIAIIHRGERHSRYRPILTINPPGPDCDMIVQRSYLMGTVGKTPTRLYGWF